MATAQSSGESKDTPPGKVTFLDGQNELPAIEITTAWSTAEIYLHGAHVTRFKKKDEPPILFMSQCSRFEHGEPIRGGVPVIFPWFGPREGMRQHGYARLKAWELKEFASAPDGSVSVRFHLPDYPEASAYPAFSADYVVAVSRAIRLELIVTNNSPSEVLAFENCLHTYFEVGDAAAISIKGLKGASYLDKTLDYAKRTETADVIRISSEVDRAYLNTTAPVEILDPVFGRKIHVEKDGSQSTVVWNPWIARAQEMPDFGNEEYLRMVCVESGNVAGNSLKLPPRQTSKLSVVLSSEKLA